MGEEGRGRKKGINQKRERKYMGGLGQKYKEIKKIKLDREGEGRRNGKEGKGSGKEEKMRKRNGEEKIKRKMRKVR